MAPKKSAITTASRGERGGLCMAARSWGAMTHHRYPLTPCSPPHPLSLQFPEIGREGDRRCHVAPVSTARIASRYHCHSAYCLFSLPNVNLNISTGRREWNSPFSSSSGASLQAPLLRVSDELRECVTEMQKVSKEATWCRDPKAVWRGFLT